MKKTKKFKELKQNKFEELPYVSPDLSDGNSKFPAELCWVFDSMKVRPPVEIDERFRDANIAPEPINGIEDFGIAKKDITTMVSDEE